jgi:hypothetical protein
MPAAEAFGQGLTYAAFVQTDSIRTFAAAGCHNAVRVLVPVGGGISQIGVTMAVQ